MPDKDFYNRAGPYTLDQLAEIADAQVAGRAEGGKMFTDIAPLHASCADDVTFLDNPKYNHLLGNCKAGVILLKPELADEAPESAALLVTADPYKGFAYISAAFYPEQPVQPEINPSAQIHETAEIGANVVIAGNSVIGPHAIVGDDCQIGPNSVIGKAVKLGAGTRIGPNCTLIYCILGEGCLIHGGVRIGQDGFGFAPNPGGHVKVPQLGLVVIGDEVEIGANTAIDRGSGPDTTIGSGTKIDNLVQIGHNVQIGRKCLIAGQVGIAGSAILEDLVFIGGQAGINGHVKIGKGVRISGQAGVTKDVPAGETITGTPAENTRDHWRKLATIRKLTKRGKV